MTYDDERAELLKALLAERFGLMPEQVTLKESQPIVVTVQVAA